MSTTLPPRNPSRQSCYNTGFRLACGVGLLLQSVLASCASRVVPSPSDAIQQWSKAVRTGDAQAVHALLSREGRRAHSVASVRRQLPIQQHELATIASDVLSEGSTTTLRAHFEGHLGWSAELISDRGPFRVASASIPQASYQPRGALRELRRALEHRSYAALLRVLTRQAGRELESETMSLLRALEDVDSARIAPKGRTATVDLSGGHQVTLEREDGIWKVKDFD